MNKITKLILSVTGAVSLVFDIATPILLAILIINTSGFNQFWGQGLIIFAIIATLYRGIKHLLII